MFSKHLYFNGIVTITRRTLNKKRENLILALCTHALEKINRKAIKGLSFTVARRRSLGTGHPKWRHELAIKKENTKQAYVSCILLERCELPWLKISRMTAIKRVHPQSICPRRSSGRMEDHMLIQ
jgi:hypothetical protein